MYVAVYSPGFARAQVVCVCAQCILRTVGVEYWLCCLCVMYVCLYVCVHACMSVYMHLRRVRAVASTGPPFILGCRRACLRNLHPCFCHRLQVQARPGVVRHAAPFRCRQVTMPARWHRLGCQARTGLFAARCSWLQWASLRSEDSVLF